MGTPVLVFANFPLDLLLSLHNGGGAKFLEADSG
jgi:hypothetical protein